MNGSLTMPDTNLRRYHCEVCGWNYWLPRRLAHWLTEHKTKSHTDGSER